MGAGVAGGVERVMEALLQVGKAVLGAESEHPQQLWLLGEPGEPLLRGELVVDARPRAN
jgi:hypothetical protein